MNDITLNEDFRAFAVAALKVGATMLQGLRPEQHHALDGALQAGARLSLELTPLPAFERLDLVLVEHEGARRRVTSAVVAHGPYAGSCTEPP